MRTHAVLGCATRACLGVPGNVQPASSTPLPWVVHICFLKPSWHTDTALPKMLATWSSHRNVMYSNYTAMPH
eukprot:14593257-Alexandrium_andersonii.AAC.1